MVTRAADAIQVDEMWPPDDTEESIVGAEYHQRVIAAACAGLSMAGQANKAPWHAQSQIPVSGFIRPNGSTYTIYPDVFVHPRPNPHPRNGQILTLPEVGVPLLAIEVLSASTYRGDTDERYGKAWSYAEAGVAEYLMVDYDRAYIREPVRARRLVDGRWTGWSANAEGRWESFTLGVSFAFDDPYLRVYDGEGRLTPLAYQAHELLLERDARITEQDALKARMRELLAAGDFKGARKLIGLPHD